MSSINVAKLSIVIATIAMIVCALVFVAQTQQQVVLPALVSFDLVFISGLWTFITVIIALAICYEKKMEHEAHIASTHFIGISVHQTETLAIALATPLLPAFDSQLLEKFAAKQNNAHANKYAPAYARSASFVPQQIKVPRRPAVLKSCLKGSSNTQSIKTRCTFAALPEEPETAKVFWDSIRPIWLNTCHNVNTQANSPVRSAMADLKTTTKSVRWAEENEEVEVAAIRYPEHNETDPEAAHAARLVAHREISRLPSRGWPVDEEYCRMSHAMKSNFSWVADNQQLANKWYEDRYTNKNKRTSIKA